MRTYHIFNNNVSINLDDDLIEKYESVRGPLDNLYVEHMAVAYDMTENDSIDRITAEVIQAIEDEIDVFSNAGNIVNKAIKDGVIK